MADAGNINVRITADTRNLVAGLSDASRVIQQNLGNVSTSARSLNTALNSIDASRMTANIGSASNSVIHSMSGITSQANDVNHSLNNLGNGAASGLRAVGNAADSLDDELRGLNNTSGRISDVFRGALGAEIAADALRAFAEAAKEAVVGSIRLAGELEQSKIAFGTMLGSAEKADSFLRDLANFAANTPFELKGLESSSKKLLAFGFDSRDIIPIMRSLGDAIGGLGGGTAEIDRVTMALGQMSAKGKVSAEEMNQLAELGIPAWKMLADNIGKSIPEAMKLAEKGAIQAGPAIQAIITGMNDKFGGMMEKQSKTFLGAWSNMTDGIDALMRSLGGQLIKHLRLTEIATMLGGTFQSIAKAINESGIFEGMWKLFGPAMQALIIGVATAIGAALMPRIMAMGAAFIAQIPAFIASATAAITAWAPFLGLAAAIAFAATPIMKYWDDLAFEFGRIWEFIKTSFNNFINFLGRGFSWVAQSVVTPFVNWMSGALSKLWNALPDGAKDALTKAGQAFGKATTFIGSWAGAAAISLGSVGKFVAGSMKESFSDWGNVVSKANGVVRTLLNGIQADVAAATSKIAAPQLHLNKAVQDGTNAAKAHGKAHKEGGGHAKEALSDAAKAANAMKKAMEDALRELPGKLANIDVMAQVLGNEFDTMKKKSEEYKSVLTELIKKGFGPMHPAVVRVKDAWMELVNKVNDEEIDKVFNDFEKGLRILEKKLDVLGPSFDVNSEAIKLMEKTLSDAAEKGVSPMDSRVQDLQKTLRQYKIDTVGMSASTFDLELALAQARNQIDMIDKKSIAFGTTQDMVSEKQKVYTKLLEDMFAAGLAGTPAFESIMAQMDALGQKTNATAFSFDSFKKSIDSVGSGFSQIQSSFNQILNTFGISKDMIEENKNSWYGWLSTIVGVGVAVSGFASNLISIYDGMSKISAGVTALGVVFTTNLVPAIATAGAAFTALITGPVGMVALGAVAVAAIWELFSNWDNLSNQLQNVWNGLGNAFSSVFDGIRNVGITVIDAIISAVNGMIRGVNSVTEKVGVAVPQLDQLRAANVAVAASVTDSYDAITDYSERLQEMTEQNKKATEAANNFANKMRGEVAKTFLTSTKGLAEILKDNFKNAIIDAIVDGITKGSILASNSSIKSDIDRIVNTVIAGGDPKKLIQDLGNTVNRVASTMGQVLTPIRDALNSAFSNEPSNDQKRNGLINKIMNDRQVAMDKVMFDATTLQKNVNIDTEFAKITENALEKLNEAGERNSQTFNQLFKEYQKFNDASIASKNLLEAEKQAKSELSKASKNDANVNIKVPALANGGIVDRPTLALIGERGPEAVVPLSQMTSGNNTTLHVTINYTGTGNRNDVDELANQLVTRLRRMGVKI